MWVQIVVLQTILYYHLGNSVVSVYLHIRQVIYGGNKVRLDRPMTLHKIWASPARHSINIKTFCTVCNI